MNAIGEGSLLVQHFETIAWIMQLIAIFIGMCLVLSGIFEFKRYGEQRTMMSSQHSAAGPLMLIISGAALLIFPKFLGGMLIAVWGTDSPLAYNGSTSGFHALIPPVILLVRIIGIAAFMRGIIMLSKSGSQQHQQGLVGKAIMHLVAGILCVHIIGTKDLLEQILGVSGF